MQAASDSAETILNITCFQMQSAKELIVISKSLASSNFLLEPNVKSSKSIRLRSLYSILNSRICRMLVNANAKEQDIPEACKSLLAHLNFIFDHYTFGQYKETRNICISNLHLQKEWASKTLITNILRDIDFQHSLNQICNLMKGSIDEYSTTKNSPDGIQDVILYSDRTTTNSFTNGRIQEALSTAGIIQYGNEFICTPKVIDICKSAMRKSYKMIRMANSIILNEQEANSLPLPLCYSNGLIAPNSYYVQASLHEQQIVLILNKTLDVPSGDDGVKLFTILEKTVEIENLVNAAFDNIWNHYQSQNLQKCSYKGYDEALAAFASYNYFSLYMTNKIDTWLSDESMH
ncbi:hypothetical protein G6F42_017261 [Rhizopus arrhizus]|nr:hypothetical protein G6F42_017261 [Rhizopus arrhizus]